jgi:hypothetical protein
MAKTCDCGHDINAPDCKIRKCEGHSSYCASLKRQPTYVLRCAGSGTEKDLLSIWDVNRYLQKDGTLGMYGTAKLFKDQTAAHNAAEQDTRYTWGIFPRS